MAFSEQVKNEVRRKSLNRCVICQRPFAEIHHIIPQEENGPDTIENAAPLCSSCHDLFGGNASKRKQIQKMRDDFYEMIEAMRHTPIERFEPITENMDRINGLKGKKIAIYHTVLEDEDFSTATRMLHNLIYQTQKQFPNQERILYLDILGHRNSSGGFDHDMFELQKEFLVERIMPYVSEAHVPLVGVINNKYQKNDIEEEVMILGEG